MARGEASEIRAAHSRYFAGREADILALWDSPRQREAYDWFTIDLANLRTAFRWAADQGDLDVAVPIATYAAWVGFQTENYEPIAWAEEPVEPARAVDHPGSRLYVMASLCYMAGGRSCYPLHRGRPEGDRQWPRRPVRPRGHWRAYLLSASRNGGSGGAPAQLARGLRHPRVHHGEPAHRTGDHRLR